MVKNITQLRDEAMSQLLKDAAARGDNGASTALMRNQMAHANIGLPSHIKAIYDQQYGSTRNAALKYLQGMDTALVGLRNKAAAGSARRSSGGGSGGSFPSSADYLNPANDPLAAYLASLTAPVYNPYAQGRPTSNPRRPTKGAY